MNDEEKSVLKFMWGLFTMFIVAIAIMGFTLRYQCEKADAKAYPAWVKLTGRNDVSFEEWRSLRPYLGKNK